MNELILSLLDNQNALSWEEIVINLVASAAIGFVIFLSYWLSHTGSVYSKKFSVSLIVLTVLTATVMVVIGNNIALSLGMVGALSIVRYRTAIKDSRDTVYIFWAIIAGICCGAGDYVTGACGSAIVFIILLLMGRIKNDDRMLLVIRGARELEQRVENVVFNRFGRYATLKVKNSTSERIELIYEVSKRRYVKQQTAAKSLFDEIYGLGDIDYVNAVSQTDDIA